MLVKRKGRLIDVTLRDHHRVTSDHSNKFFKFSGDHIAVGFLAVFLIAAGTIGVNVIKPATSAASSLSFALGLVLNVLGILIGGSMLLDARQARKYADRRETADQCVFCKSSHNSTLSVQQATALRDALTIAIESHP